MLDQANIARSPLARLALALAATLLFAAIAMTGPAAAGAATTPSFRTGAVSVSGSTVTVKPPSYMAATRSVTCSNLGENVDWSPDLQRWNGSGWVNYNTSAPFYDAFTSSSGLCPLPSTMGGGYWYYAGSNLSVAFKRFGNLPAGYYRIRNWLRWPATNSTTHSDSGWVRVS